MSASTAKRRSTVHDFSTLRLHPDGSRVEINAPTTTSLFDFRTRHTGRDTRGNRVARDAAGLGVVPKRTVIREDDDDDHDDHDNADDEERDIKPRRMPLRRKRRRIDDDVEFLGDSGNRARRITGNTTIAHGEATTNWPVPSSDLLKCVHYFASQYYSARGLLSDQSRIYRREVRQWKARVGVVPATNSGTEVGADADDLFAEDVEDSESVLGIEDCREEGIVKDRERGEDKSSTTESVPDMYNALDGSALMAIGMLLQEHVSMLLRPNIPAGWEEEMEAAGLVPEDEDTILDAAESDKPEDEDISFESVSDDKD